MARTTPFPVSRCILVLAFSLAGMLVGVADEVKAADATAQDHEAQLVEQLAAAQHPHLKAYLENLLARVQQDGQDEGNGVSQRGIATAVTLASDVAALEDDSQWRTTPFICYVVPALSSQRRMPDTLPTDGEVSDRINVFATPGEYEPASFVVAPLADVDALELNVSALAGRDGEIPAEAVDVRIVKHWYQGGTAWHSYFADPTQRELVPELLLNDETLIRVDHERQENYVRVDYADGSEYVWVSAPPELSDGGFDHHLEPVADSTELQPAVLRAGRMKQFWITLHVPKATAAGTYEGEITFTVDGDEVGAMTLAVRVLPFELPVARTYHDLDKEFHAFIYNNASLDHHLKQNGEDWALAERKLRAELENLRAHNMWNQHLPDHYSAGPWNWNVDERTRRVFRRNLEIIASLDFRPPLFDGFFAALMPSWMATPEQERDPEPFEAYKSAAAEALSMIEDTLGHREVYFFAWDEPPHAILENQSVAWEALHELGANIYATSRMSHFTIAGYREEIANFGGFPIGREATGRIHALDHRAMSYAGPHTGPENPDFARRNHGMLLYKLWYDGTGNYMYYSGWNDFRGGAFRSFNMVYPTQAGVIDTIAWEGVREGLDDIRYATKLKQLAEQAIHTGDVETVYQAKQALVWLELLDEERADLDTARLEMIHRILDLQRTLAGGD